MSDNGARSSHSEGADRSYFGQLTGRFLARYDTWKKETHAPQTKEQYAERLERSQTATCARIGALHYQMEEGVQLLNVTGIDSHVFERKWLEAGDGAKWLCFHANFSAFFDGDNHISFFFMEATGIRGPELVTRCARLRGRTDYSVKNCRFCTGLWHPLAGNFLGRI